MISSVFIKRPITSTVLSIVIVIVGLVSLAGLRINQYPAITPVQVSVSASYPGADAETVANTVAAPIETQVNGADNMLYMQSISSATGEMALTVFFDIDTDPDTAEVQVNNRVNIALPQLPETVRDSGVKVQKRSSNILMLIGISSPDGRYDEQFIGNYANLYILDALKRVPGANQASIMGLPDLAMRLWLQPDRMASMGLTANDIQQAVSKQNQLFAAGQLGQSPTTTPVEMTFPVVTQGRFDEAAEFEEIILRADAEGAAIVRFKDVGRAEEGQKSYMLRSTLNGSPSTFVAVYQQPGSNAIEVAKNVIATMEELKQSFPQGIEYKVSFDTTKVIQASIDEVVETLVIAIILVVLVTYLFLQKINTTLIPTVAIFVSVIGTFSGMAALGYSINLLTLFGLVLAIGIVCDDAIVVVENVERNIEDKGLSPKEATFEAMREVTGPVIATTLVLVAVFVPVGFLEGTTGVLYQQFAVTIAISVLISSIVALTLTPALSAILIKPAGGKPNAFFRAFNTALDKLTRLYTVGVHMTLKGVAVSLLLIAGMLFATYTLFRIIPGSFVPPEDQGYLFAAVILPDGASLDRSQELTQKVAEIFAEHPAVEDYSALAGYSLIDGQFKTNSGTVFVSLKDFAKRQDRQKDGAMVPLSSLVTVHYVTGADLLPRFNGFMAAKVTGDAAPGFSSGQTISTMEEVSNENLPDGFSYSWSGQSYEEKKSGGSSAVIFVFALLMVFLILAAQYEQWSLPIAVITAVPFGIFGALVSVWLRGRENDVYFQIGLVTHRAIRSVPESSVE